MSWIGWILLGALAGLIAKAITKEEGGLLKNIIVGILGGVIGGWIFDLLGGSGVTGFNLWSLLVAVVGALVLLWLVRLVTKKK